MNGTTTEVTFGPRFNEYVFGWALLLSRLRYSMPIASTRSTLVMEENGLCS
jgi:hypothetical protein